MAWVRCCGAKSGKTISVDLSSLSFAQPSNTSAGPNVKRTFTKGTYCLGLSDDNQFYPSYVNLVSRNGNTVTIKGVTYGGYGFGYVLPNTVEPNKLVTVKFTKDNNCRLVVCNYKSDGTFLNSTIISGANETAGTYTKTFSLPSNAEYGILLLYSGTLNVNTVLTLESIVTE